MYNLFALTDEPQKRVCKFTLSQDVQRDITTHFKESESEFASFEEEIVFDGRYKPDISQILVINDFDDIDDICNAIKNPLALPDISPFDLTKLNIKAIFVGYQNPNNECVALFQKFNRSKVISPHGLSIYYSGNTYKRLDGSGITLEKSISARLIGKKLQFFSFHIARQIFDLTGFFIEATDKDIDNFSKNSVFSNDSPEIIGIVDIWCRRKIASINQSGVLSASLANANDIISKAKNFNIAIEVKNDGKENKILIPKDKKELKKLLRFLDDDYYESLLSTQKFLTNSKRKV